MTTGGGGGLFGSNPLTGSIGVVILESADRLFGDPFFWQLMLGISAALADRDRRLMLMLAPTREEEARIERHLVSAQIDGIVLVGPAGQVRILRSRTADDSGWNCSDGAAIDGATGLR